MIELIFMACLATNPVECEERRMHYVDVSLMQCVMAAQPQLAKWTETHPGWQVGRWKCSYPRTAEKA
ncbi:hypothetical protein [Algicella marina]|uniref:Secreted protein n=1 Tax=Algicella marina TaxID=2683284 RepID=A0A6P1SZM4_9RHOB|nr:hypothetical protein [Algicella marina]QHQ34666.1 hypothetical protein GO499_05400 [Algicella marina]